MTKNERLIKWVESLDRESLNNITIQLVRRMIETEEIRMWDDTEVPYWDADGERLDGSNN